jgi:hypothetical protein
MFCFPKIPMSILFNDSIRGAYKQQYVDSKGEHQYYKELNFIRQVQKFEKEKRRDYIKASKGNYCPLKLRSYLHNAMMANFGYSTLMEGVY